MKKIIRNYKPNLTALSTTAMLLSYNNHVSTTKASITTGKKIMHTKAFSVHAQKSNHH